jgi:hypothetical protein
MIDHACIVRIIVQPQNRFQFIIISINMINKINKERRRSMNAVLIRLHTKCINTLTAEVYKTRDHLNDLISYGIFNVKNSVWYSKSLQTKKENIQ